MKNLVLNRIPFIGIHLGLFLMLLLNGCSMSVFNGYHRNAEYPGIAPASWFRSDTGHYLFNTKIDVMKKHFSGLMVIKPLVGGIYRVVFITEVGLKIFDMEFFPDKQVKVHYIMDAMNKKALIKTLTDDLSLVLMNGLSGNDLVVVHEKGAADLIYSYRNQRRKYYYYVTGPAGYPYRAKQTAGITNKVKADLYGNTTAGIDSVKIAHYNFRLSINLFRIREETEHATE